MRAYAGLGLAAMALSDHPGGANTPQEWADHAYDLVTRSLWQQIDDEDGSWAEGPFYGRYAADVYLPWMYALRNLTGVDLFADPQVEATHRWSLNLRLPSGRRPNIDDAHLDDAYGHYLSAVYADGGLHRWDWEQNENGPFTRGFNEMDAIAIYDDSVEARAPDHGPTVFMPAAGTPSSAATGVPGPPTCCCAASTGRRGCTGSATSIPTRPASSSTPAARCWPSTRATSTTRTTSR